MKKAPLIVSILVIVVAVVVTSVIYYNNQQSVIISKNFGFSIPKDAEILYFNKEKGQEDDYISYKAAIRISDKHYDDIIKSMQNTGYERYGEQPKDEWMIGTVGWEAKNWLPIEGIKPEVERYELATVKREFFIFNKRLHRTVHITDSIDGYREFYMCV